MGISFLSVIPHNVLMNILQNIFNDHYEELIYITHPRHSVIDNVDRMLGCGDPSFGAAMYGCTSCGNSNLLLLSISPQD